MKLALWICFFLAFVRWGYGGESDSKAFEPGDSFSLGGEEAMVVRLHNLPWVDSEYSRRFKFDSFHNPKLNVLREKYRLEKVISKGATEFDRQVMLMNWVHEQFPRFGKPSMAAQGGLEIMEGVANGGTFFCSQYAQLMVSAAASLGWVDRSLALRRHQGVSTDGSTEHATTEIFSNQYGKWVMLDPTSNLYLERGGVPLNAAEIRQEWFYNSGKDLLFVIGKERKKYRKGDLPVFLKHFPGFGDLKVNPEELDKYGFIGYIPNTDLMDAREDYGNMFITKDKVCDGTKWHVRPGPKDPLVDPYFPINQAHLLVRPSNDGVAIEIKTLTPNLKKFEMRTNRGKWRETPRSFVWKLDSKKNHLEARAINQFGVPGPISELEIELREVE